MKLYELKQIIRECIDEIYLDEASWPKEVPSSKIAKKEEAEREAARRGVKKSYIKVYRDSRGRPSKVNPRKGPR